MAFANVEKLRADLESAIFNELMRQGGEVPHTDDGWKLLMDVIYAEVKNNPLKWPHFVIKSEIDRAYTAAQKAERVAPTIHVWLEEGNKDGRDDTDCTGG